MIKYVKEKINTNKIDWYLNYIYFYIFVTPLHLSKSQTSVLSIILFLWAIVKYRKEFVKSFLKISKFLPLLLFFLFIVYIYISSLWSEDILNSARHVSNYTKYYFLFIPAILISLNTKNSMIGIKVLILSFATYSIYSILIYLNILHIADSSSLNPKGHLRYLIVSQYMVIAIFSSFLIAFYSKCRKEKILFLIVSFLTFFTLFINNSRTAQLSFFFILFLILIYILIKRINFKILASFLIILILAIGFLFNSGKTNGYAIALNEYNVALEKDQYRGSFGARLYFNKVGIEILKENLFFGTGPLDNRYLLVEKEKVDPTYKIGKLIKHFHSEHMDILTAYGIFGYVLLLSSILYLIYTLRNKELYFYLSIIVFLTLFFNSFANKTLSVKPLNYVYILFFILFAIIAYKSKENQKAKIENNS